MATVFNAFAEKRIMIMSAPNGARRTQADHPRLPITSVELAKEAVALRDAGVSILHLHVRDEQGRHSLDADRYREAITAIRERVGDELIIQVTTEAVGMYTAEQQMAVVRDLMPEAVSVALREICPTGSDERETTTFFDWMRQARIWPQTILYSVADVERFDDMRRRGVFADDHPFAMFVLGNYANGIDGKIEDLDAILGATDCGDYPWAVCCFGAGENAVMVAAEARGGHVRIGFENNLMMNDGRRAPDNAALIREFVIATGQRERRPAIAAEIRAVFPDALE